MSLVRCLPLAGVNTWINLAIQVIGFGWLGTISPSLWLFGSLMLLVYTFMVRDSEKDHESKAWRVWRVGDILCNKRSRMILKLACI